MDDNTFEYKKISILRLKKINELNNMIDVLRDHIEDLNEKLEKFISGEFANNETNLDNEMSDVNFDCSTVKVYVFIKHPRVPSSPLDNPR